MDEILLLQQLADEVDAVRTALEDGDPHAARLALDDVDEIVSQMQMFALEDEGEDDPPTKKPIKKPKRTRK